MSEHSNKQNTGRVWPIVLGALGVVYGDIGTSPLYALRECFHSSHAISQNLENILGVLSLITWAIILEVSLKYILFVMSADNRGEGGVLALTALAAQPKQAIRPGELRSYLILLGLFGSALLYGDGVITPAISVLSAVEGLKIATPLFQPYIISITVVVLCLLFNFQSRGTERIGKIFGPIILAWFFCMGVLGLLSILETPGTLHALNPYHAINFLLTSGWQGFIVLGAVFLAVTGGEALYADMGHFGKRPIRLGWFTIVLPCLLLNYYGQASLLIREPAAIENPFYKLAPSWFLYPLVVLATLAAVIASQALITGAFSLTRQAVQLGCLPRITVNHTSSETIGQIYVPLVNRGLLLMTTLLVIGFESSSNMAAAYGIAVSLTMVITTILIYFVARQYWGWSRFLSLVVSGPFLLVDIVFLSANVIKIHDGGWVTLAIAGAVFTLMTTWRRGRQILAQRLREQTIPLDRFLKDLKENPPLRVPGTAIFMTGNIDGTPPALIHNLKHNKIIHQTVVLLMVAIEEIPTFSEKNRVEIRTMGDNVYKMMIHYGFMETPNIPEVLQQRERYEIIFDTSKITYFLGRETVLATQNEGMAIWREKLFALMSRNAARATTFYCIPSEQVIEIGLQVEI